MLCNLYEFSAILVISAVSMLDTRCIEIPKLVAKWDCDNTKEE
jgi:hypothetical protein